MIAFDDIYNEDESLLQELVDAARLEGYIDKKLEERFKDGRRDWTTIMISEPFSAKVCRDAAKRYRRWGWVCRWDGSTMVPFFNMKPSWWRELRLDLIAWLTAPRPSIVDGL